MIVATLKMKFVSHITPDEVRCLIESVLQPEVSMEYEMDYEMRECELESIEVSVEHVE